jgi:hypothetical protein
MSVDQMIANNRAGACMCGRTDAVMYGPHPFGYGNCCLACQREWSRMHGDARWQSNDEQLNRLHAERARARADGRDERTVSDAWNRGLPPFERPKETARLSQKWKDQYEVWAATLKGDDVA